MNIGVYFEVGGFNTLTTSDSIIDQYATLAQAESQSHSENVKFGMRRRMESGKTLLNHTQFLGYTKGENGELKVVLEEAEIMRKFFSVVRPRQGCPQNQDIPGGTRHQDGYRQNRVEYFYH